MYFGDKLKRKKIAIIHSCIICLFINCMDSLDQDKTECRVGMPVFKNGFYLNILFIQLAAQQICIFNGTEHLHLMSNFLNIVHISVLNMLLKISEFNHDS